MLAATALSLWRPAHFRTRWSLFVAGAREPSCFGGPKGSTLDMVVIWTRSNFVTGAMDRDFATFGSFSEIVAGAALGEC